MTLWTLLAVALSATLLVVLCHGDPKRRRAARCPAEGQGKAVRRSLVAAACLPGVMFAAMGDTPALLVWFGASAVAGWAAALWFGRASRAG